ncbi:MAG: 6-carboxytetrahydropterin synthase [Deltaproteobacteria bacterium]|jgi:6-pyruvoyltetrahydropterin/6-carboxytetrahydropterin synthase|nr:6-carboxytetrahydropterin synthase [Deltaproteobacteria bacterium]
MNRFRIYIQKESYKFSATHFTIFSATQAERLHGHNYAVGVECELADLNNLGMGFEFNTLKPHIKKLADHWDEHILIAGRNPFISSRSEMLGETEHQVFEFNGRSYRFPKDEVRILPVSNITSEELAREFAKCLVVRWFDSLSDADRSLLQTNLKWIEVSIEETRGQKATYRMNAPFASTDAIKKEMKERL